ncbi:MULTISPECIES: SoxR reducing system RseC family protein [Pelosinus]|uniref:Positive regulator of sigma(E) RseC/MucC n=1 Tax=Pelosinus fermentans B4 TaxID=1149862 RepID=I8RGS6_9FIRM|nr:MULTISPECIES: SoxR reducing system RseC family protein [Pelosinus]EIW17010.1 Positive regulator of sigma(E) RseC/MucC [Pelosinus fermentans B4]EIW23191.1 positive regulator of sigma E, RseC/MucC [Pelosinus fermentans A11]OAM93765.1 positive regulator of sigma E, RseC/MucC [Pelosinus fermentans DSM 17108]SDQ89332.1 positive regulator of sigma(E), RseC/MucC [Pelosinus fermentans]
MDKQQEGIVLEVVGNHLAKVKTSRHNDCENCGACPGNSALVLEARNDIGAKIGQRVAIEVREVNMLKAAFIVYILPLILIFFGAVIGGMFAEHLSYQPLWFQIIGGTFAFILSVVYIKFFDSAARSDSKMQPMIVRILSND